MSILNHISFNSSILLQLPSHILFLASWALATIHLKGSSVAVVA